MGGNYNISTCSPFFQKNGQFMRSAEDYYFSCCCCPMHISLALLSEIFSLDTNWIGKRSSVGEASKASSFSTLRIMFYGTPTDYRGLWLIESCFARSDGQDHANLCCIFAEICCIDDMGPFIWLLWISMHFCSKFLSKKSFFEKAGKMHTN